MRGIILAFSIIEKSIIDYAIIATTNKLSKIGVGKIPLAHKGDSSYSWDDLLLKEWL
jgi:hypothetical protein